MCCLTCYTWYMMPQSKSLVTSQKRFWGSRITRPTCVMRRHRCLCSSSPFLRSALPIRYGPASTCALNRVPPTLPIRFGLLRFSLFLFVSLCFAMLCFASHRFATLSSASTTTPLRLLVPLPFSPHQHLRFAPLSHRFVPLRIASYRFAWVRSARTLL